MQHKDICLDCGTYLCGKDHSGTNYKETSMTPEEKEQAKAEKAAAKEAAKAEKQAAKEAAKAEREAAKGTKKPRQTMASSWGELLHKAATDPSYTEEMLKAEMISRFPAKEETVVKWTGWYKNFYNMGKLKGYENPVKVNWTSAEDEAKKAAKEQAKADKAAAKEAARQQKLAEKEALKAQKQAEKEAAKQAAQ